MQEYPGKSEFCFEGFGERLYTEDFRRVVARIKKVHMEFFRSGERPVRPLSRDEGVDSLCGGIENFATCRARDHTDPACNRWSAGSKMHLSGDGILEAIEENPPVHRDLNLQSDLQKGLPRLGKFERVAQQDIVSQLGMRIEWQMGAVNGQIVLNRQFQLSIAGSGRRLQATPKQPVMDDQQVRTRLDRHAEDRFAGIHRRSHPVNRAGVFQLEAVERIGMVIELQDTEQIILILHDFFELHLPSIHVYGPFRHIPRACLFPVMG